MTQVKDSFDPVDFNGKFKRAAEFWTILGLLIATRVLDNYITYLMDPQLHREANLFVKLHGFGWGGVLVGQALLLAVIGWACRSDIFGSDDPYPRLPGLSFSSFLSYYHTGSPGQLWEVFLKLPHRKEVLWRGFGYTASRTFIIMSVLVSISNLCLFLNPNYRAFYRKVFPLIFPLGICVFLFVLWLWGFFRKEYRRYSEITNSFASTRQLSPA